MSRVTNLHRAHWAAIAIEAFRDEVGTDDDLSSIHNLIADLGHYSSLNRLDFVRICADAISCWQTELADPKNESIDAGPRVSIKIADREPVESRRWRLTDAPRKPASRKGRGGSR